MKLKKYIKGNKIPEDDNDFNIIDADFWVKEDLQKKKNRFMRIKNPITEMKTKRDEAKRRKEEELRRKREQEERERKRAVLLLSCMSLVCFLILGIMSVNEKNASDPDVIVTVEPILVATATPAVIPKPATKPTARSDIKSVSSQEPSTDIVSSETTETTEPNSTVDSTPTPTPILNPYHKLDNMSISARTDYAHFAEATIIQGNGETFYVVIDTKNKDATVDDVVMFYEDTEIQILSKDYYYGDLTYPRVEYHCQALKEGDFEIQIASTYDDFIYEQTGKDYDMYVLSIKKLNSYDGQIVYISYYGDKYHKSSTHAGDSWQAVTLWDAVGMGIEPCNTCY